MPPEFSTDDLERFGAFREAARQVREASIIDQGKRIGFHSEGGQSGGAMTTHSLLDSEPFRSLAMSLRLVYLNDDPGNYGSVCNRLRARGPETAWPLVDGLRARYNQLFAGKMFQFQLNGDFEGQTIGPRQVFETWLYQGSFHQAPELKGMHQELKKFGGAFAFVVQGIALQMAGCVLDLDDVVADVLAEPRVPRIGG